MLSIYEAHEERIKCQLYQPVYEGEGATKTIISWIPSDKFCYCKEKGFKTQQRNEGGMRIKSVKGTLETYSLKNDEITLDWKIMFDNELYVIDEITQEDDNIQQTYSRNCLVKTTLEVRR